MATTATDKTTLTYKYPEWAAATLTWDLLSSIAINSAGEVILKNSYSVTLDENGEATDDLPTPDSTGDAAWLWRLNHPDGTEPVVSFGYSENDQDAAALLAAEVSTTTASDIAALVTNKQDKDADAVSGNAAMMNDDGEAVDAGTAFTDLATESYVNTYSVSKSGDTMTGALVLPGAPTIDLHAATKKYVDDNGGGGAWGDITGTLSDQTDLQTALDAKAALAGATFTGNVLVDKSSGSVTIGDGTGFPTLKMRGSNNALLATASELQLGTGFTTVTSKTTFTVTRETAGTNDVINGSIFERRTTGTAAAGLGITQVFRVEDASGTTSHPAYESAVSLVDATNATYQAKADFNVYYGAFPGTAQTAITLQSASGGGLLSFHGATPQAQSSGWAVSNVTPDKVFDADSTSLDEIADVLGTLITHLIARGDLAA